MNKNRVPDPVQLGPAHFDSIQKAGDSSNFSAVHHGLFPELFPSAMRQEVGRALYARKAVINGIAPLLMMSLGWSGSCRECCLLHHDSLVSVRVRLRARHALSLLFSTLNLPGKGRPSVLHCRARTPSESWYLSQEVRRLLRHCSPKAWLKGILSFPQQRVTDNTHVCGVAARPLMSPMN